MMKRSFMLAAVAAAAVTLPLAAEAQGTVRGAARGAETGAAVGGPVGAVVGGAVGAATGTVGGILGVDARPRFRSYVETRQVPSYDWDEDVRVGVVLPSTGVTYYDVPREYGLRGYRYTVVNDTPVIVEPRSGRIVEVIED